ncbi:glycosyltransferase family 2 protein [Candidatus Microgenomates bacterium]|nr:glycosyltransferase family 2 protein [Candidatus Microgenomates bacterium]
MRLILSFFIGLVSFFYLAELFQRLGRKYPALEVIPITHSLVGIIFIAVGIFLSIFGQSFLGSGLNILSGLFLIGSGIGLVLHHLLSRRYILSERIEKDFVLKHENLVERILEILPGAITWLALTSPVWLSFTLPYVVAYLILIADVYWLLSALKIGVLILIGYRKMEVAKSKDWLNLLQKDFPQNWQKYYHLILIPTYKEPPYILTSTFEAILNSNYSKDKMFLAVGFEERDDPKKITETKNILKKIESKIAGVFTTIHPYGLPGEVPGQGSNKNWMINNILTEFKKRGIKIEDVFVTTLDADFCINPQFLAGSLHKYLSQPQSKRDKRSFTGVFLYHNNYWQTPTPMRLMATGTSFWQLAEMVGSDKYINYSSMSISLKALLDVGLWIPDKVNDDSGFYWKAYFHFNGDYKVIPHFLPISGDAVQDTTLLKTFQNQYLQIKRWAYGVEHIPFIVKQYFKKEVDFWDKTDKLLFKIWGDLKWGFLAIFVTFGSLLIPLVNPSYKLSVLSVNLPIISSWILTTAFLGLFATILVHEKTVPKRPKGWSIFKVIWSYIQWLLVPIILITISSLPAIDAQTSLMFGKKLEFRVTNKARLLEKNLNY